ncbi:hypothetical protein [Blautia sp. MSJ-19]|uniref:hypothetical protein n=1 Tax=Blautia sp. MSJ-19 TaxID=2841517 RepID=UPI001C0EA213|nr:hypothetical protein [Blautia sp. MSJ-19]MBU5481084.1 hypothetical protein [Blautia sp. MSJ-19]
MKAKYIAVVLGTAMAVTMAGCGFSKSAAEVTPTPIATPTPTEVPATVTPVPTSTPAPKVIGVKTSQAKYIYLTNGLQDDLREIYLMTSGGTDWGKNLIPSESSVKASEQVQMFYTPETTASDSSDESEESASTTVYDLKIVTSKGEAYEIYSVDLSDMEKASLAYDEESSTAYLRYTSLADKSEKDTKGNSQQTASDVSSSSDSSDTSSYSYDDSSSDSSYDDGSSSDDSSYDNSYDDSNYDDGSSDDSSYDDGSSDDGDDGSYDDGSYDDGSDYVDEGSDSEDNGVEWDY